MRPKCRNLYLPALLIVCSLFMAVPGISQDRVVLNGSGATGPVLAVDRSGLSGVDLNLDVSAFDNATVSTKAGTFNKLSLEDYGFNSAVGSPCLPAIREFVEIPHGGACELVISDAVYTEYLLADLGIAGRIVPVQPPLPKTQAAGSRTDLILDAAVYNTDAWVLGTTASIVEDAVIRGRRVAVVEIFPLNYNPAAGKIRVLTSARVSVVVHNADGELTQRTKERYAAPSFDRTAGRVVINAAAFDASVMGKQSRTSRATGYLIIAAPAYVSHSALQSLVSLRTSEGYDVTLVDTNTTGTSTTAIKSYIQNAYNTWNPAPEFLLLVGDTNTIPAWSGSGSGSPTTDLNYACVQGSDYFADISRGRLPVRSSTQLTNLCDKILDMASMTVKEAVFMASEDNWNISEGTHNNVINNYLNPDGWTSDKLYCHTYNATTSQVTSSFNDGRTIGCFSGHGYSGGWSDGPAFNQNNVRALVNTVYPFVFSFSCSTAPFAQNECFGETWVVDNHGATSFFGASLSSYWTEDDILEKRMFRGWFQYGDDQAGTMIDYGQYELYLYMGAGSFTRMYYEMYNLLGEPAMQLIGGGGGSSDLSVGIVMDSTTYQRGDWGYIDLSITNSGAAAGSTYYWINVTLPNSQIWPASGYLFGPTYTTVNGGDTQVWNFSRRLPNMAPLGSYFMNGYIGISPPTADDTDSFALTVVP